MAGNHPKTQDQKIVEILRQACQSDAELRTKYQIGEKFRFIRDRLHQLLNEYEKKLEVVEIEEKKSIRIVQNDETSVYVHLFNANGLMANNWLNMLTPAVFYEYSVNRPIYLEKKFIDALIRSKAKKIQHAYLEIIVKKSDIVQSDETLFKDVLGQPVIKVKEGSLSYQNVVVFVHNDQAYLLSREGLIKQLDEK